MATQSTALNPTSLPFYPTVDFRTDGDQTRNKTIKDEPQSSLTPLFSNSQQRGDSTFASYTSLNYQLTKSSPAPTESAHLTTTEPSRPRSVSKEDSFNSSDFPLETHSIRSSANSMSTGTASDIGSVSDLEVVSGSGDSKSFRLRKEGGGMNYTLLEHDIHPSSGIIPVSQPITILRTIHRSQHQESPGYAPPVNAFIQHKATPPNLMLASSPTSSAGDSSARASTGIEYIYNIDAQLKASPFINDILDRLSRYELSNREVQRELGDVRRKLDVLIARSIDATVKGPDERASVSTEPVFRNPFASTGQIILAQPNNNIGMTSSSNGSTPGSTPPVRSQDEIIQLSQRLNTLTAAVTQMLALQTQQHVQSISGGMSAQSIPNNFQDQLGLQMSLSPGATPPLPLPNRPDLRPSGRSPSLPMRTWSVGSLELPPRAQDPNVNNSVGLGRPTDLYLRDKRRSTVNIMRRDSTMTENAGETWNNTSRESGPVVSKWEHLAIAPELLRSIAKFGIGPPNKIQQRALPFLLRGADIIAQAPPTQERIAAYVIPAIHIALGHIAIHPVVRGPLVVIISTTVDQATQAQRMIRDFGGPIGVRSALGVGATRNEDILQELQLIRQNIPHILCGTPHKLHALFTAPNGLFGGEVRFLVLDEVDQLIARNLHEYVFNIVKLLPPPRSRPLLAPATNNNQNPLPPTQSSYGSLDQLNNGQLGRRFSAVLPIGSEGARNGNNVPSSLSVERQTALFSNTVPQDVLNLANAIQLREPVRVLVRRDGNVSHADNNSGTRGLRQFYLYLALTAGGRSDAAPATSGGGLGIIGSGRNASASSAETAIAREWKLDALADIFVDIEISQAIVHVGGLTSLDAVVYKLASRGLEAVPLHGDMNAGTKLAALNKFRGSNSVMMKQQQPVTKVLVVYDVQVKAPDVFQVPLVINYDLPKAVEEYAHRVAPAISTNFSRAGVVVNFVTATGGDVEMLRSIECFYKIKCPEVPISLRDIL